VMVGGSEQTPGGLLLAGVAALRAGAGKLQLATSAAVATSLAVAVPEARVISLPCAATGPPGAFEPTDELTELVGLADAVLVGTASIDPDTVRAVLRSTVSSLGDEAAIVIDAGALPLLAEHPDLLQPVAARAVVMPNPSEAARLLDLDQSEVHDDPEIALDRLVEQLQCVVALRASDTLIAAPGSRRYLDRSGHPALATSGSGDVLAGMLTALVARGAVPLDAALWAVHLHGRAGEQAAGRIGGQGILARELADEIPRALVAVSGFTT